MLGHYEVQKDRAAQERIEDSLETLSLRPARSTRELGGSFARGDGGGGQRLARPSRSAWPFARPPMAAQLPPSGLQKRIEVLFPHISELTTCLLLSVPFDSGEAPAVSGRRSGEVPLHCAAALRCGFGP